MERPEVPAHPVGGVTNGRPEREPAESSAAQRDVHPAPDHQRTGECGHEQAFRPRGVRDSVRVFAADPGGGGQRSVRVRPAEPISGGLQESRARLQRAAHHAAV